MAVPSILCRRAEQLGLDDLAKTRETAFSITGFRNWKKALQRFREHANSHSHLFAVERVSQHTKSSSVSTQLSTQLASELQCARVCLEVIFSSTRYLARHGLALRGYDSSECNSKQLLKLRASNVSQLDPWLERKIDLTSPKVQNGILQLFSHCIVRYIASTVRKSGLFAIMVNGTQDVSREGQMAICLRYVDDEFYRMRNSLVCASRPTQPEQPLLVASKTSA